MKSYALGPWNRLDEWPMAGKRYEEHVKSSRRRQQAGRPWLRGPCLWRWSQPWINIPLCGFWQRSVPGIVCLQLVRIPTRRGSVKQSRERCCSRDHIEGLIGKRQNLKMRRAQRERKHVHKIPVTYVMLNLLNSEQHLNWPVLRKHAQLADSMDSFYPF